MLAIARSKFSNFIGIGLKGFKSKISDMSMLNKAEKFEHLGLLKKYPQPQTLAKPGVDDHCFLCLSIDLKFRNGQRYRG